MLVADDRAGALTLGILLVFELGDPRMVLGVGRLAGTHTVGEASTALKWAPRTELGVGISSGKIWMKTFSKPLGLVGNLFFCQKLFKVVPNRSNFDTFEKKN